jgi:replication factor A1
MGNFSYMISMSVADHTGQAWLSGFNDVGVAVFGKTAEEMVTLKESDESGYLSTIHKAACHTFNFSCRAKIDTYNVSFVMLYVSYFSCGYSG